ncbi:hypothetical protein Fmac_017515 [Flemingia macrophylla]|uniref:Uncharacterized protein n=1 Tax=Flemingia macrophylla TaxID=520843 RepID=A0ABD1M2C8_9FABA
MEGCSSGVRKGAWNKCEDDLLKACVERYGEGKWHLVPQRAGLSRCRKSCRLRWLNYLNPNIKRGPFSEDEIDMMIRLHKLLGNRWSLIAGRLPGRTSNDVKNYWNTHMRHNIQLHNKYNNKIKEKEVVSPMKHHEVIKPVPQTFSKTSPWFRGKLVSSSKDDVREAAAGVLGSHNWWKTFLNGDKETLLNEDREDNVSNNISCLFGEACESLDFWDQEFTSIDCDSLAQGKVNWDDFLLDLAD